MMLSPHSHVEEEGPLLSKTAESPGNHCHAGSELGGRQDVGVVALPVPRTLGRSLASVASSSFQQTQLVWAGKGEPCPGRGEGDLSRVTLAAASVSGLRGVAEPLREHRQESGANHCLSLDFQLQFSLQILAIKGEHLPAEVHY